MAYTVTQLTTFFTNANAGTAPTAAQTLTLQALANQNASGTLTNDQALASTVDLASDATTAVSVGTYEFFLGFAPSEAGLTSLNTAYVTGGAQAGLNGENRFIAQAVSLALTSGKTAFTSSYGSLSVADATKAAYNIIIGNAAAAAAGVNVDNAVAFLTSTTSIAYYTAFVKANVPGLTTQADIDLAVKAAIVGEILYVATSYNNGAGLGSYATASTNLIKDLADDGHLTANNAAGVDLFGAYGPGGVGSSFTLTAGIDTVTGTSGNDTIVGNTAAGALALTTLDTIDGGQGNDTLTLSVVGAVDTTTAVSTTIKNVETVNVVSTGGVTVDSSAWAGVTALNVNGAIGAINVDAAGTTAVKVVAAAGAGGVAIDGGSTVNATITNVSGGATTVIGGATAAAGNITASVAVAAAATAGALSATTEGGTSISLTQTKGSAGSTTGFANAIDGAAAAGKLGTLTTVALDGNNGGSVTSNALTSLSLANNTGTVNLTNNYGTGNATTTLGLTVNNAGGTLNDASAVYSTINITTTGKASSLTLTDTALKTLSTAGTQKLTLGTVPTSVTAYTGSGTGSLSATFGAALKTYASTATGGDTVTLNTTALTTASFGGGKDTVTINGALATTTISLGAGDDKLVFTAAPTAGATLSGGDGTDAISVTNAIWTTIAGSFVAADVAKITGFETLSISDSGVSATYNLGVLPTLTNLTLETGVGAGNNINVTNFVSGQTITVGGVNTTGTVTAVIGGANTNTADVVNLVGNATITQNNNGATVDVTANTVHLTAVDVETVNFKSTGTLSTAATTGNATDVALNTLVITNSDTALTTVNITGDQNVSFTSDAAFTKLATVNASGLVGVAAAAVKEVFTGTFAATVDADTITFDGVAFVATAAQTGVQNATAFTTFYNAQAGAHWVAVDNGNGTVTFTQKTGGAVTDVLTADFAITSGGAGADTSVTAAAPSVQGSNAISAGATIDVSAALSTSAAISVTGSAGNDTITIANKSLVTGNGGDDTYVVVASTGGNTYSTVLDANKGDVFKTSALITGSKTAITGLGSTAVFQDFLDTAAAGTTADHKAYWFQFNGDTYIVQNESTAATFQNGTDIVVKLTGLVDLSKATWSDSAHTITLA